MTDTHEGAPCAPHDTRDDLPHPLTFFLREGERREAVRALRALHRDRVAALRIALGMDAPARRPGEGEGGER